MQRHLFAVAAGFSLSACMVQPPPGYWARGGYQYPAAYPSAYAPSWDMPRAAYAPPPAYPGAPTYADQGVSPPGVMPPGGTPPGGMPPLAEASYPVEGSGPIDPPPRVSLTPTPASYSQPVQTFPSLGGDGAYEPRNPRATFADEAVDYGVPPTNTLHLHDFDAPTPTHIQGARTITTMELRNMMASDRPPVLIDVIGGQQNVSLPNAIWLRDAGSGRHLDDDVQAWLDLHLANLTARDKSRPLVFFCASRMCWMAHNATLRALDLGYTNVSWYRGGRDSWQAAGLPMAPVAPTPIDQ